MTKKNKDITALASRVSNAYDVWVNAEEKWRDSENKFSKTLLSIVENKIAPKQKKEQKSVTLASEYSKVHINYSESEVTPPNAISVRVHAALYYRHFTGAPYLALNEVIDELMKCYPFISYMEIEVDDGTTYMTQRPRFYPDFSVERKISSAEEK